MSLIVDDTVHVNAPGIACLDKRVLERSEDFIGKLRSVGAKDSRAHFTGSGAFVSGHELLVFEVLEPPSRETERAYVGRYRKFDARNKVLENEFRFQLPAAMPFIKHKQHVLG